MKETILKSLIELLEVLFGDLLHEEMKDKYDSFWHREYMKEEYDKQFWKDKERVYKQLCGKRVVRNPKLQADWIENDGTFNVVDATEEPFYIIEEIK